MSRFTSLKNLQPVNAAVGHGSADDSRAVFFCCPARDLPDLFRRIIQTADQKWLLQVEIGAKVNIDSAGLTIRINNQT